MWVPIYSVMSEILVFSIIHKIFFQMVPNGMFSKTGGALAPTPIVVHLTLKI